MDKISSIRLAVAVYACAYVCNPAVSAAEVSNTVPDSMTVKLRNVEVVANRANKRTPVAFSDITAKELARIND